MFTEKKGQTPGEKKEKDGRFHEETSSARGERGGGASEKNPGKGGKASPL